MQIDAARVVAAFPVAAQLHAQCESCGLALNPMARAFLTRKRGIISVSMVWRSRKTGTSTRMLIRVPARGLT